MAKTGVTLEPSNGVISQMAAHIYAAYISQGLVKDGENGSWMQRSIREAVRIAKIVEASIKSADEPDAGQELHNGPNRPATAPSSPSPATGSAESSAAAEAGEALKDPEFDDIVGEALHGVSGGTVGRPRW